MIGDLYREIVLDHHRRPRHDGRLADATIAQRGHNPLCGDEVEIGLRVVDDRIEAVGVHGQGCAISQASASMLSELAQGVSLIEAETLVAEFTAALRDGGPIDEERFGDAAALAGVRQFPMRVKCASLAWHTLAEAIELYRHRTV